MKRWVGLCYGFRALAATRSVLPWCVRALCLVGSGTSEHPDCATSRRRLRSTFSRVRLADVPCRRRTRRKDMEVLYPHCAGLDVHKDTVVACVRHMTSGTVKREVRTFKTTTTDLLALSAWLASEGCTHVVMEATGVYWKPVWHILSDGEFALTLANAAQVKNVPGSKTDVNDATWLADLLAHGLVRASFVPDPATQEQRGLLRTRKQLVRERASHVQRLQRTLEDANIKLDSAVSDITGLSGRAMIEALIAGQTDPAGLAELAHRRLRASPETLREALRGRVTRHHRFLLALHLKQIDALDEAIAGIDAEVDTQIEPFRAALGILSSIPGVGQLGAH